MNVHDIEGTVEYGRPEILEGPLDDIKSSGTQALYEKDFRGGLTAGPFFGREPKDPAGNEYPHGHFRSRQQPKQRPLLKLMGVPIGSNAI